ncbi:MAG: serine protease [Xanthobacteraceae bacterium]
MRLVATIVVLLASALAALAQFDPAPFPGTAPGAAAPRPAPTISKFRPSKTRTPGLRPVAGKRPVGVPAHLATPARKKGPQPASVPLTPREATLPLADRIAIQFDLAWTGDYNGIITGEWNDRAIAAVKAFQRNRKFRETGGLTTQERALLAAAAKAKQAQVGWAVVDDSSTGIRLGVPSKQVPNTSQTKSGTRWSSAEGQVQIETFKLREAGTTLASVYEQQKKVPSSRKLEVNVLKGDLFILAGVQDFKKFYVRAELKDGEVRGVTVLYDQATQLTMDPVTVAMSGAFTPFPSATAVAQTGPAPKRMVEYGSGIVVSSAGHIVTDRGLTDSCNVIVVSGHGDAVRQAEDKSSDLALLRVYGVPDLTPASFAVQGVNTSDVTLVGIADPQAQAGGNATSTTSAKLHGSTIEPSPPVGFSGGAAVDAQGRLVGMIALKSPVVAQAGSAPTQALASLVGVPAIRAFLEAQKLAPATASPGIDAAKPAVVRVICVRK